MTQPFEAQQVIASQTLGFRNFERKKIQFFAVPQKFKMKMRTGCMTGLPNVPDHLSFLHRFSLMDAFRKARKMCVAGHGLSRMADIHNVAVSVAPADKLYASPAYGHYGRSRGRGVIDGLMRTHRAVDRVQPGRIEGRRNSCVTERRASQRAPQRSPISIIIRSAAVVRDVKKSAKVSTITSNLAAIIFSIPPPPAPVPNSSSTTEKAAPPR